jgi:hypothetical protein
MESMELRGDSAGMWLIDSDATQSKTSHRPDYVRTWTLSITATNGEIAMAEGYGNILVDLPNAIPAPEPFRLRDVWYVLGLFWDLLSVL